MKKQIAIYGASGFGREVAWLVESCTTNDIGYEVVCFIDDDQSLHGKKINEIPIIGFEQAIMHYNKAIIVAGIGNPFIREKLINKAKNAGFGFETIIHPRVERSRFIKIGTGAVICAGSILTANILIGKQVQINLGCTIGHDVIIGDYTTLSPGVHVSGWVHFGKRVLVGTGAIFINGTEKKPLLVGDDSVIGGGAVVTKDISPNKTYVGVPAKSLPTC